MIGEYSLLTSNWLLSPLQCLTALRGHLFQGQILRPGRQKKIVFYFIIWEKANCSHLSLVFYKVIDIIQHNYIHIFKGLQIKRHFCHQFWILRIKDTYILDNVKKAYVSHKIMLFGSCLLSFAKFRFKFSFNGPMNSLSKYCYL